MLTELFDKIDNNTELMGCLAVNLGKLTEKLGPNLCISLVGPLELLAGADDAVVRTKTIESLIKIGNFSEINIHQKNFVDLIERLAKGDLYSQRISSAPLFPLSIKRSSDEVKQRLYALFMQICKDDTPMVRRAAASAFGEFSIANEEISEEMIETFKKLLSDGQDAV